MLPDLTTKIMCVIYGLAYRIRYTTKLQHFNKET